MDLNQHDDIIIDEQFMQGYIYIYMMILICCFEREREGE